MGHDSKPSIGVFKSESTLLLEHYPNGGWVIIRRGDTPGQQGDRLGAYSNAGDMLDALSTALLHGDDTP